MKRLFSSALCVLVALCAAYGQDKVTAFDKYVETARQEWNVPGLSVVVVHDGKVVMSKGYGVKEINKNEPVDAQTLFGAMSTTKAMTAAAMGMLVDEGKISWDDKVVKHLPDFRVGDPYITADLRVRDLFTHNAGLGNADFLWAWTPELSSAEIVRRMQYAIPAYPLRGGYTYQNVMYLVAGQVIEKVSGMPWNKFVTDRVFAPLGMTNTFANYERSRNYQNRSSAHFDVKGKITMIPEMVADSIGPAGAVWSTSDDIGKWLTFMLGDGTWNGKLLLKPATMQAILRPQVIVTPGQFYPTVALTKPHWTTYGFGWFQHDYRGEMVEFHTGSLDGRTAIIGMLRDKKLGVYIFGNLDHAELRHALMYKVFDLFGFGDDSRDWSKEMKAMYDRIKADAKKQEEAIKSKRAVNTKPSLALANYAGKYGDPFHGTMEVKFAGSGLRLMVTKDLTADLGHWHYDTFLATWNKAWWDESLVSFKLNAMTGDVESLELDGVSLRRLPN